MRGYFEHEYLKFKKSHLSNLIALAKIDGDFHENEEQLIFKIGKKYKLKKWQIENMVSIEESADIQIPSTHQQKMDQLYDLVRMIYADNIVADNEIDFCKKIAIKFAYKPQIIDWLVNIFKEKDYPQEEEWNDIVKVSSKEFLA
jgi:uncharacterized tellurite resistance protein B-like protein